MEQGQVDFSVCHDIMRRNFEESFVTPYSQDIVEIFAPDMARLFNAHDVACD